MAKTTPGSVTELSISTQNYLKAIWSLSEWSGQAVTTTALATRLGLRLSSVSDAMRRLAAQGLITHERYGSIELSDTGHRLALAMVRRHRLIETYLVRTLGYSWDKVHDEAENLEHCVSDYLLERVDTLLGYPQRDPHGDPIPQADGSVIQVFAQPLNQVAPGFKYQVERISDEDPNLLQFLGDAGISIGTFLRVAETTPFGKDLHLQIENGEESESCSSPTGREIALDFQLAGQLYVSLVKN